MNVLNVVKDSHTQESANDALFRESPSLRASWEGPVTYYAKHVEMLEFSMTSVIALTSLSDALQEMTLEFFIWTKSDPNLQKSWCGGANYCWPNSGNIALKSWWPAAMSHLRLYVRKWTESPSGTEAFLSVTASLNLK